MENLSFGILLEVIGKAAFLFSKLWISSSKSVYGIYVKFLLSDSSIPIIRAGHIGHLEE